jgi:dienelactone hydrolase
MSRCIVALALVACALGQRGVAADLVTRDEAAQAWRVQTEIYQATLDARGWLVSLRLGGTEWLGPAGANPCGGYFYQDKPLTMTAVTADGPNALLATAEPGSARYVFAASGVTIELRNLSARAIEFVFVVTPAVTAVMSDEGQCYTLPGNLGWQTSTWFCGERKARISGSTRLWGPYAGQHQVWHTTLAAKETRTIGLEFGTASAAEQAQVAAAGPVPAPAPATPPPAPPVEPAGRFQGTGYEAAVGRDGCCESLRVDGVEFMAAVPGSIPRGGYCYQEGLLTLDEVKETTPGTWVASSPKAEVTYAFAADRATWSVANRTAKDLLYIIVLAPGVEAVIGEKGYVAKAPLNRSWAESTWFCAGRSLGFRNLTRVWGPWNVKHQILQLDIPAGTTRSLDLLMNTATPEQRALADAKAKAPPPPPPADPVGPMWDLAGLSKPPATFPAEGSTADGVKAVFYESVPYQGRPTRVFAWIGIPEHKPGERVPGMVLVHGGGGTAFDEWVRRWTARGYAAIAMDTCGCLPGGEHAARPRHDFGGPPGWGGYDQIDEPREDQWTYHAVSAAVLGHSLLRSLPEVDPERIGLTGISWGGYLTCIIAGVDPRFKLAVPVYGCGFTAEHGFAGSIQSLGPERGPRWMRWWDPSMYLKNAAMPFLWVTGSNDFAYTPNALQKSYRLPTGPRTLCVRLRMPHGHGDAGEGPLETFTFADSILKGGEALPRLTGQGQEGRQVWATFTSPRPVAKAELNITKATGNWQDRLWEALPATLDPAGKVSAELPAGVTVYYLNLFDDRNCAVSTEHVELPAPPATP